MGSQRNYVREDEVDALGLSDIKVFEGREDVATFLATYDRVKQDENGVTFAYNIKREEEHLDFNRSAREVFNHIRGLYPFPTSYMIINDEIIKVCESRIGDKKNDNISTITSIYDDGIGIMCNDKEIIITRLKPSGKKEMSARDYLNGKKKDNLLGVKVC